MTARRRVLVLSLATVFLLGLAVAVLLATFLASDSAQAQKLKAFFLVQLEQNLGRKIQVGSLDFEVFPSIKLNLSDLTVWDPNPERVFFQAGHVELVLRLIPLLRGEVVGKRLYVDDLSLNLRRDGEGRWNFMESEDPDEARAPSFALAHALHRVLRLRELTIRNGKLSITDESHANGVRLVQLESLDLAIQVQMIRRRASVHFSAALPGTREAASLSLAGTLTQTQPEVQISDDAPEGMAPRVQFGGTAEATNLPLRDIAQFLGRTTLPPQANGTASFRGRLRLVPGVVGYDVVLSDLTGRINEVEIAGHAALSGLNTAQQTLALTLSSSQIQLNDLFELAPASWFHPGLPRLVAEHDIRGTLEVVKATLTGVMTPEPLLSFTGEFQVREGHGVVDMAGTTVEKVSGTVFLEPGRMRVVEIGGIYGSMRIDAGKAMVSFLEAGPRLELELRGEMQTADLLDRVEIDTLLPSRELARIWNEREEVEGVTRVGFRISGPLNHPEEIAFTAAAFEALDVSFRSPQLGQRVTGVNGRLVLSEKGAEFDSLRGWVGQTQVELHGWITGGEKNAFKEFTVTARATAADLLGLLPFGVPTGPQPVGRIEGIVGLSGPLRSPQFKGRLDLDDAEMVFPVLGRKPRGRPASLEFDGALAQGSVPLLTRVELVLPSLRVTGRGRVRLDDRFRINAAVGVGPIAVTLLPDWMRPKGLERGEVEVSLDVRGKGTDWHAWQVTGWAAVTNGVWSVEGIDSPVRDVNLRLKLVPNGAELKQLAFRILDSDARFSGVIRNWQRSPSMTLTMDSDHFDLELLIPSEDRSPVREFLEELAASGQATLRARLKRGTYDLLSLSDLSFRVNITKGVLDIDRINGKALRGQVDGRLVVRLPRGQPASAEGVWRVSGVPFEDLEPFFREKESPVSGEVFFTGTLRGDGDDPEGVKSSLNGTAVIRVVKGRIFRDDSRPVWKILSKLSLPAQLRGDLDLEKDGFPFDEITATLTIDNGRLQTDNIVLDSPVVKMTGAGSYDIPNDQMDLMIAVSPFGPYQAAIKSIPLFGSLLKGERNGLATALFEVTGPLEDPRVKFRPLKSFASGLGGVAKLAVDILVNIVTLPQEIIAPSEEAKPDFDTMPELTNPSSP
ncbi:MAG: AsmA-like C-terminal domain-containing protein [Nitrospirales bacterium]